MRVNSGLVNRESAKRISTDRSAEESWCRSVSRFITKNARAMAVSDVSGRFVMIRDSE